MNEIEKKTRKYLTTPEFNKFIKEIFHLRLIQTNLASQSDIASFVNKTDFDSKVKMSHQTKMN